MAIFRGRAQAPGREVPVTDSEPPDTDRNYKASSPITPELLASHVIALRAEVSALRTVSERLTDQLNVDRKSAHHFLDQAIAFKLATLDLTQSLIELNKWRTRVDERLEKLEEHTGLVT